MELSFKLPAFEGPLGLLLHLIDRNKVDIYDIPIAEITDQYLAYIAEMEEVDLDLMSDFLLMAATLLDIKARMLLPEPEIETEEEEDPRADLVNRLIEYRKFKLLSDELRALSGRSEELLFRQERLPGEVAEYKPPVNLDSLLSGIDPTILKKLFEEALRQAEDRESISSALPEHVARDVIPIETGIRRVRSAIKTKRRSLRGMFAGKKSRDEVIVTFLAILELLKSGDIILKKDNDDMILEVNDAGEK